MLVRPPFCTPIPCLKGGLIVLGKSHPIASPPLRRHHKGGGGGGAVGRAQKHVLRLGADVEDVSEGGGGLDHVPARGVEHALGLARRSVIGWSGGCGGWFVSLTCCYSLERTVWELDWLV